MAESGSTCFRSTYWTLEDGKIWLNVFPVYAAILLLIFVHSSITYAQNAPPFPERQWLGPASSKSNVTRNASETLTPASMAQKSIIGELIDFAQSHIRRRRSPRRQSLRSFKRLERNIQTAVRRHHQNKLPLSYRPFRVCASESEA